MADTTQQAVTTISSQGEDKPLDEVKDWEKVIKQVDVEYQRAYKHLEPKISEGLARLKLYNNQMRDKEAVGDTTLFTVFQSLLADFYTDRLNVTWIGREEGDEDQAENLNLLTKFDHDEMRLEVVDYDWNWDTLFFGRGLMEMSEYKRDPKNNIFIPIPRVCDPLTFLRDERATSVHGDPLTGENGVRFWGREVKMTQKQMEDNPNFFKDIKWKSLTTGDATTSLQSQAKQQRDSAQNRQTQELTGEEGLGENTQYSLLEWNTHIKVKDKVKKVKIWSANERTKVVGYHEYDYGYWPLFDRPLYPTAHDFDGVSVSDVLEDKQRARAVIHNLGLNTLRANLYPRYLYDSVRITNKKDLDFGFNKHVGVNGPVDDGVIRPVRSYVTDKQMLDFMYNTIDLSAQKAVARPEMQQGVLSQEKRTLGELNLVAANVNTRDSLVVKIFGWSERARWRHWYQMYKRYFADDIDEKIMRLSGAFGPKYRKTKRKDIITPHLDPDVFIESANVTRATQLEERQLMSSYFALAFADPSVNKRWGLKKLAKLNGLQKDEIDRLFPLTIDERDAEDENELLNDNKFVQVFPEDDDNVHLELHAKAEATGATIAHIETHKKKLLMRKTNPELFPGLDQNVNTFQQGTAQSLPVRPTVGGEQRPMVASQSSQAGTAQNLPPIQQ